MNLNTRIINKNDTLKNWEESNLIPHKGEIIVYNDLNKIKIGDGINDVNNLHFTDAPFQLNSSIGLNTITTPGKYEAATGNSITNKPSQIDAFTMDVSSVSDVYCIQVLYPTDSDILYRRFKNSNTWSNWVKDLPSVATSNSNGLMSALDKTKLDSIAANASAVSYTPTLTEGTEIGKLKINGNTFVLYTSGGNKITISNVDLIPNESELADGEIYLVYED